LNDFTVITGENGSGKSQLFELIKLKKEQRLTNTENLKIIPNCKKLQLEGIEVSNLSSVSNDLWRIKVENFFNEYKTIKINTLKLTKYLLDKNIWLEDLFKDDKLQNIDNDIENLTELIQKSFSENYPDPLNQSRDLPRRLHWFRNNSHLPTKKVALAANSVAIYTQKPFEELLLKDFLKTEYPENFYEDPSLFNTQLENIFYHYAKRRYQNSVSYFRRHRFDEKNSSISDTAFDEKNLSPWELVNKIFTAHNLDFHFEGVATEDFIPETSIYFPFIKTSINKEINFSELSSGEKTIIGLVLKIFTNEVHNGKVEFPDLLILDEPDAHLHPQMSKLLIDVLNESFVEKLGIKVIMTTHSPSTIALCPEDSIYQLKNHPQTSLKKIGKDEALKILTGFLPTLSIDYKNHRQVFVESPTDLFYYQTIFAKLSEFKSYPFRLYFISNSMGEGNCDQVKKVVSDLRESGNQTSFGIIDWDLKNAPDNFVMVHGHTERYSVENFIYDPIYLTVLLMKMNAHNIFDTLGLSKTYNYLAIFNASNDFLQKIADAFFIEYYSKNSGVNQALRQDLKKVEYYNGKFVNLPVWFLESQGHDFEKKLEKVFPAFEKYKNEGELQKELTLIIATCYPLIPLKSVEVLEQIISNTD